MPSNKLFYKWRKERDETLEKRSVEALIEFQEKWSLVGFYSPRDVELFKRADPKVQMATLCKAIANVTTISVETRRWALLWLAMNGFSPNLH